MSKKYENNLILELKEKKELKVICSCCNKEFEHNKVRSDIYNNKECYICDSCYFDNVIKIVKREYDQKLKRKLKALGIKPILKKLRAIAFIDKDNVNKYALNLSKQALRSLEKIDKLDREYNILNEAEWISHRYGTSNFDAVRKEIREYLSGIKEAWSMYKINP